MQALRDVLKAYSIHNEQVGYCQVRVDTLYRMRDIDVTACKNVILNFPVVCVNIDTCIGGLYVIILLQ